MRGTLRCERCGRLKREFDRARRFARFCQPCASAHYLSLIETATAERKAAARRRVLERVAHARQFDPVRSSRLARRDHASKF